MTDAAKKAEQPRSASKDTEAEAQTLSNEDAVKFFKGEKVSVPVKDKKTGETTVVSRAITADDILSVKDGDKSVSIVTVDGRKLTADK